ncbi:MAG TPA: MBOAT family O-acyltransferase [Bacteroidales bacterium]|nr:MBOAT family O-acyltransferase [Bacteroidales bacterium]
MVFSSVVFIFAFLPVFLAAYYLVPKLWAKNILLLLFSMVFYFWGAGKLVILLLFIGFVSWFFSWLIARTRFKKGFLVFAILTFIGILIYNKYLGFIIDNLIYAGISGLPEVHTMISLGVSFFTFQAVSYNIDVYRKNKRYEQNPFYIILYITMFPQLISGPLVRYQQIGTQLKDRVFSLPVFAEGIKRFIIGLGKKVIIANQLGALVNLMVDNDSIVISPLVAWTAMAVFAIQIFFDFSGYTDMAIGIGKMLGFELPENFNFPYISRSVTEFWRRWHMSFASWIKDYIFTPLAFQMRYWGKAGIVIALMITFTVCGIWHGPTWNFLIWGLVQGLFLSLEELFLLKFLKKLNGFAVVYLLFIIVTCLVFFRTENVSHAFGFLSLMFSPEKPGALGLNAFFTTEHTLILLLGIFFSIPVSIPDKLRQGRMKRIIPVVQATLLILLFIMSVMRLVSETYNPFIYFKF